MSDGIQQAVQSKYGSAARSGLSSSHGGVRAVAEAFGYTPEQLASIPAEANMGLSCGNPTAFASLKPGETVVDLGCGVGLLLAADLAVANCRGRPWVLHAVRGCRTSPAIYRPASPLQRK